MARTMSVQDRRQAALERLGYEPAGEVARTRRRRPRSTDRRVRIPRLAPGRLAAVDDAAERASGRASDTATRVAAAPAPRLGPPPLMWYGIIAVTVVMVMLGLVMVLSASAVTESNRGNSPYGVFLKQAMWAGFGLLGLTLAAKVPYVFWRRLRVPLALAGIAAMAAPFLPVVGGSVNGARAWIRVGGFSVQPSECLKLVVVVLAADLLTNRSHEMSHRTRTLLPLALIAGVGAGMCMVQGDLGSAIVLGAIVLSIGWIAGIPFLPLGVMTTAATGVALLFVVSSQSRIDRFTAFLDVTGNKDRLAWQTYQGFVSMASGGLGGSGIGGSNTKLGYLPYAHSDFIFAIIADELGMLGAGAVIGGFILLVLFGVQTALAAPDRFGMLVAGGVAAWFGVQALVNLGGVTGLMPVTGLTLPFFSAGGSSLFVSMVAVGLLLSVARRVGVRRTKQASS